MAFSPKIQLIDLSACEKVSCAGSVESLKKLLGISGSIKSILLGQTNIFALLDQAFFLALGENKSVETLVLDAITLQNCPAKNILLGRAIGLNSMKNGSLQNLSLKNTFHNVSSLEKFFENMFVSEFDHETLYGDQKVAKDMKAD